MRRVGREPALSEVLFSDRPCLCNQRRISSIVTGPIPCSAASSSTVYADAISTRRRALCATVRPPMTACRPRSRTFNALRDSRPYAVFDAGEPADFAGREGLEPPARSGSASVGASGQKSERFINHARLKTRPQPFAAEAASIACISPLSWAICAAFASVPWTKNSAGQKTSRPVVTATASST